MDYNSIDEDDVENLRLAALMTLKKKSYSPLNTENRIQKSEKCFSCSSSYSTSPKNNEEWIPTSNKLFSKCVNLKKSAHPNSNLISIIPSDIDCDFQSNLTNSTLTLTSEDKKSSNIPNLNNEVSTKFSRLEHKSDSLESEDSESEKNEKEESSDCDILSLGEKDKDLDDLEKLMDIIETEIACKDGESSIKESSNLKTNNNFVVKNSTELNVDKNEPIRLNQPKTIEDFKSQLNPLKEGLKSVIDLKTNTNSPSQSTSLKSCVILKSPMASNRKTSNSPYIKYLNRCSTTVDHSKLQSRSSSPRRLSPIKEKNISPVQYSPKKSQNRPSSLNKTHSFVSKVTLPNRRQLSPVSRKSRSPLKRKSRSPIISTFNKKSYSPKKKLIKSRLISPTILRVDNNDNLQKTIKVKPVEKQVKLKQFDSALENQLDVKKKSESFYPTRLLQSAIKDVVDSSANEEKKDKCSYKPEIKVPTEDQYNDYDGESYTSIKRLKSNFKKVPLHSKVTGAHNNNTKLKGLKMIIRQNINVTDIDQVFDVLIICNFFFFTFVKLMHYYYAIPILHNLCIAFKGFTFNQFRLNYRIT
ncbi:probable myosin light chain kinase DDB_G0279831 isoform X2 [Rhopalosiphum maidis]|uniref:probable myosin light chain kinase DDB_G0279831 isoform X2 n=1 Tax=Rhopalosiphum maidis TaxID=43146 RepID=UPI000EFE6CE5|nr:probable myosin light chain kinase DDB_G0279831 isoform X2 [Rhopalosiphum maidis]